MSELNKAAGGNAPASPWQINPDLKAWKVKEQRAFFAAINSANDVGVLFPYLTKLVKAWPFEADPADPASYDELTGYELEEVLEQVKISFQGDQPIAN